MLENYLFVSGSLDYSAIPTHTVPFLPLLVLTAHGSLDVHDVFADAFLVWVVTGWLPDVKHSCFVGGIHVLHQLCETVDFLATPRISHLLWI